MKTPTMASHEQSIFPFVYTHVQHDTTNYFLFSGFYKDEKLFQFQNYRTGAKLEIAQDEIGWSHE